MPLYTCKLHIPPAPPRRSKATRGAAAVFTTLSPATRDRIATVAAVALLVTFVGACALYGLLIHREQMIPPSLALFLGLAFREVYTMLTATKQTPPGRDSNHNM